MLGIIFHGGELIGPPPTKVQESCIGDLAPLCKLPLDDPIIMQAAYMPLSFGLAGVMISLSHFSRELVVFKRESLGGLSMLAYFSAKVT
jgi:hypothetical protein